MAKVFLDRVITTGSKDEEFLAKWLAQNGVVIERLPAESFADESDYETSVGPDGKAMIPIVTKPSGSGATEDGKRIILEPDADKYVLLHEAAHTWLANAKKYRFFREEDKTKNPNLQEVARAKEFNGMQILLNEIHLLESELFGNIYFGDSLTEQQISNRVRIEKAMGMPEKHHMNVINEDGTLNKNTEWVGTSFVGNLADETYTLRLRKSGHPMDNYSEYFASFMTSIAYDKNGKTLESLKAFRAIVDGLKPQEPNIFVKTLRKLDLSEQPQEYSQFLELYKKTIDLFSYMLPAAEHMIKDMKNAAGKCGKFQPLETMEKNLAGLMDYVYSENAMLRKPSRQDIGIPIAR